MIYPSADKLENWGSKYSLVVLAARRAKQLKGGASPMVNTDSRNPLTIALEEIAAGKILCQVPDNDLPPQTAEPEVAQLLAISPTAVEGEEEELLEAPETLVTDEEEEEEEEEEHIDEDFQELEDLDEESEEEPYVLSDEEDNSTDVDIQDELSTIPEKEPKPKTRGRKKKSTEPDIDLDAEEIEPVSDEDSEEND